MEKSDDYSLASGSGGIIHDFPGRRRQPHYPEFTEPNRRKARLDSCVIDFSKATQWIGKSPYILPYTTRILGAYNTIYDT